MDALQTIARCKLAITPLSSCLLSALALASAVGTSAAATTLQVANCNDTGNGSLREALASAQSGDTVDLRSLACDRVASTSGELVVAANDLLLQGPGSARLTISSIRHSGVGMLGINSLRIADGMRGIDSKGTVSFNDSIVTGFSEGGGIVSTSGLIMRNSTVSNNGYIGVAVIAGDVTITGSTMSGNRGGYCAALAIYGEGIVRIENTTISGNQGTWSACISGSSVTIANSTIAFGKRLDNSSLYGPSGIGARIGSPQLTLESTIFANNTSKDLSVSASTVIIGHNNLATLGAKSFETGATKSLPADTLTSDPLLQPLAANGGLTLTHALGAGSPAIDGGNNFASLHSDQRGSPFMRSAGSKPDIGAFESQPAPLNSISIGPGFTGSWFDSAQSGHGLMLEVLPDNRLLAMWFAFNPEGNQQSWFGGVGTYSGNTATISDVALPTGGRWIPNFNPNAIARKPWGTLTFTFSDCNHGLVEFSSLLGYGSDSMDLTRLTQPAGLACP